MASCLCLVKRMLAKTRAVPANPLCNLSDLPFLYKAEERWIGSSIKPRHLVAVSNESASTLSFSTVSVRADITGFTEPCSQIGDMLEEKVGSNFSLDDYLVYLHDTILLALSCVILNLCNGP